MLVIATHSSYYYWRHIEHETSPLLTNSCGEFWALTVVSGCMCSVTCHTSAVYVVPSEIRTLSVIALSNSSVYVAWTQPLQPNGIVTGQLHCISLCWLHSCTLQYSGVTNCIMFITLHTFNLCDVCGHCDAHLLKKCLILCWVLPASDSIFSS